MITIIIEAHKTKFFKLIPKEIKEIKKTILNKALYSKGVSYLHFMLYIYA